MVKMRKVYKICKYSVERDFQAHVEAHLQDCRRDGLYLCPWIYVGEGATAECERAAMGIKIQN